MRQLASSILVGDLIHISPLPPLEHFKEAETGFEEPIMLEDHLMKSIERQIATGVRMFESGDGCVEAVGLISQWRVLGGDHFQHMLPEKRARRGIRNADYYLCFTEKRRFGV